MTAVSLEQMLEAREKRVERQRELLVRYGLPLVSFTVNMPGPYKKTAASRIAFKEGCRALLKTLEENGVPFPHHEPRVRATGYEAYTAADADAYRLKALVLRLEEEHPLGRLFDFDVIGPGGEAVSREALDRPKRRCLLCGGEAHACARSRRHPVEALSRRVEELVEDYTHKAAAAVL